jgi:hypothetical protein
LIFTLYEFPVALIGYDAVVALTLGEFEDVEGFVLGVIEIWGFLTGVVTAGTVIAGVFG